mmetsp:Transcript_49609/g.114993  ORF Transcript_49609/g.114993 Transcript_49609/m.114993 type:complete len:212 (-) Transcript_49609:362-997(-)
MGRCCVPFGSSSVATQCCASAWPSRSCGRALWSSCHSACATARSLPCSRQWSAAWLCKLCRLWRTRCSSRISAGHLRSWALETPVVQVSPVASGSTVRGPLHCRAWSAASWSPRRAPGRSPSGVCGCRTWTRTQTWTLAASSGASHGACARALSASAARCRRPARTAAVESSRWRMALETTRDQNSRQCLSISHATLGGGLSVRLWRAGAR